MSSGGFWPGEPPAGEEEDGPELLPAFSEPPAWPAPRPEVEATDVEPAPPAPREPFAQPEPEPEPMFEEPEPAAEEPRYEPMFEEPAPPVAEPEPEPERAPEPEPEPVAAQPVAAQPEPAAEPDEESEPDDFVARAFAAAERILAQSPAAATEAHVPGELDIPDGVAVLEGSPSGAERTVGVVVSRFNGEVTNRLLESAIGALVGAGVAEERITVMPVPGAFELPIGAMALAKTRRYSCVVALGCIVRGETPHFDFVATEASSGLQLAGLETGVPVAFGVLTVDTVEQAQARTGKGADAARAALEMADLFAQVRAQAKPAG